MPFRIMISLMVIALMVPALAALANDMEMAADEAEGESLAELVADASARAYLSGAGSSVSLTMDMPAGRSLAIGGEGADAYTIRIFSDGEPLGSIVLDNPPIRLICPETVVEGYAELLFEAVPHEGRLCVAVTVA